ncbi:hypothetical protein ACN27G_14060 [Plantactinospora sp. WMMB334]|jgi:hypothetical protein|uniref:hypothetical protein n=1 Tax=unclassified Plantactinospora TaxID=2631981 RepID=UPI002980CD0C|nr:hypothetical protein [Plantactinospora sp. KLBMP9567]MDW5322539.1 hypothetical protein [Plantactinospora sp. KLBMP9567]
MPVLAKKVLTWLFVGFLIFFVAFRPDGAAELVETIGAVLMAIAQGIGDFLTRLMA